jgi:hypothetical protein
VFVQIYNLKIKPFQNASGKNIFQAEPTSYCWAEAQYVDCQIVPALKGGAIHPNIRVG